MTMEERLLKELFEEAHAEKKSIDELTSREIVACSNGYNTPIEVIIDGKDGKIRITGGTLFERCLLTKSDIGMVDTLKETTVEDILKVATEEGVALYIFEDVIVVISDMAFACYESITWCLPISTDLAIFKGTEVEINDLR